MILETWLRGYARLLVPLETDGATLVRYMDDIISGGTLAAHQRTHLVILRDGINQAGTAFVTGPYAQIADGFTVGVFLRAATLGAKSFSADRFSRASFTQIDHLVSEHFVGALRFIPGAADFIRSSDNLIMTLTTRAVRDIAGGAPVNMVVHTGPGWAKAQYTEARFFEELSSNTGLSFTGFDDFFELWHASDPATNGTLVRNILSDLSAELQSFTLNPSLAANATYAWEVNGVVQRFPLVRQIEGGSYQWINWKAENAAKHVTASGALTAEGLAFEASFDPMLLDGVDVEDTLFDLVTDALSSELLDLEVSLGNATSRTRAATEIEKIQALKASIEDFGLDLREFTASDDPDDLSFLNAVDIKAYLEEAGFVRYLETFYTLPEHLLPYVELIEAIDNAPISQVSGDRARDLILRLESIIDVAELMMRATTQDADLATSVGYTILLDGSIQFGPSVGINLDGLSEEALEAIADAGGANPEQLAELREQLIDLIQLASSQQPPVSLTDAPDPETVGGAIDKFLISSIQSASYTPLLGTTSSIQVGSEGALTTINLGEIGSFDLTGSTGNELVRFNEALSFGNLTAFGYDFDFYLGGGQDAFDFSVETRSLEIDLGARLIQSQKATTAARLTADW